MQRKLTYLLFLIACLSIKMLKAQNCNVPFGIIFSNSTPTSIDVRWTDSNTSPLGWEIELTPRGSIRTGIPTHTLIQERSIRLLDLMPSTAYDLSIRTVCGNGSASPWNVAIPFTTRLENPTQCGTHIPLKDNGTEILNLDIKENGILGKDIFIKNIELIIDHTWPADLNIALETPQRQRIILANHTGTGVHHFGDPSDSLCLRTTQFSQEACTILRTQSPPFLGTFRPETDLNSLRLDTLSKGNWRLIVFDRALKDVGYLKYFKIEFTKKLCQVPKNFTIKNIDVNSVQIAWEGDISCESAKLIIYKDNIGQDTLFVHCSTQSHIFMNLLPNTHYSFSINGLCLMPIDESLTSCVIGAETSCEPVSVAEDFDNAPLCKKECASPCDNISTLWYNVQDDGPQDWLTAKGPSDSPFTGPGGDINDSGKYIFISSNPSICGEQNEVILQSVCMDVKSNPSGCDMSYYYHMLGFDIQSLSLQISLDNGTSWSTIAHHQGQQGNKWNRHTISLKDFEGQSALFRFIAVSGQGVLGQIALDQIEFYKTTPANGLYTFFRDKDGDGFGTDSDIIRLCQNSPPFGFSSFYGDCDDFNDKIFPNADEILCNGIDENCNGMADDQPVENPIQVTTQIIQPYCNGSSNGALYLDINGGEAPYVVKWNNGQLSVDLDSITEGIYYAEVLDAKGCVFKTPFYNVQAQNFLSAAITEMTSPTCQGFMDGALTVSHSIDNPPHQYLWSNGKTTKSIDNLRAGLYSVTIQDSTGCFTSIENISLEANIRITSSATRIRTPFCHEQNNGLIEISANGGQPPYNFIWNTGETSASISSLSAGTYTCTITDLEGCQNVFSTNLSQPEPLKTILVDAIQPRCHGEKNGSISTHTTGGTAPYTFLWNRHPVFADDIFGLEAGAYVLTVTDRNGCRSVLDTVNLEEPEIITISIDSITPTFCQSGATGGISVSVIGGNGGFNFVWQNNISNQPSISSLESGHYSLIVFDKLGCKQNVPSIFVPFVNIPVDISLSLEKDNLCFNERNGQINSVIHSGSPPFDYNWSSGLQYFSASFLDSLSGLPSGHYVVTITDAQGCVGVSDRLFVSQGKAINYSVSELIQNQCPVDRDGEIKIQVSGGQAPYNVSWNNNELEGFHIFDLLSGVYEGMIVDSLGCVFPINPINLTPLSDIKPNPTLTPILEDNEGTICVNPEGGQLPYTLKWSNGDTNSFCINVSQPGTYTVTISDNRDCQIMDSFFIDKLSSISPNEIQTIKVYPNPFVDNIIVESQNVWNTLKIYDAQGQFVQNIEWDSNINVLDLSTFPKGVYFIHIIDDFKIKVFKVIKI